MIIKLSKIQTHKNNHNRPKMHRISNNNLNYYLNNNNNLNNNINNILNNNLNNNLNNKDKKDLIALVDSSLETILISLIIKKSILTQYKIISKISLIKRINIKSHNGTILSDNLFIIILLNHNA